jgi:hypothetical protein
MIFYLGILLTILLNHSAFAITETAQVYDIDGDKKTHLFNFRRDDEIKGPLKIIRTQYVNLDETKALYDETTFNQGRLEKFVLHQAQLKQVSEIEIKEDGIYYSHTEDGKTSTSKDDLEKNFVVGPSMGELLRAHWTELLEGKDVDIRFAVPDRKETFGFTLLKQENPEDPANTVIIKMKAISFFIGLVVKPFYMTFTKKEMKLLNFKGMLLPKKKVEDKWKDIFGEIIYDK